jgi:predicted ArsR family transcriptional regulator
MAADPHGTGVGPDQLLRERARHQALAGISRSRLLDVLRRSGEPLGVRELAREVGLHPNTAREHLDRLVAAGLVARGTAMPGGRGRPGMRYAARRSTADADPYHGLAGALAAELAARGDGREASIDAGERWSSGIAGRLPPDDQGAGPMGRLVELLDGLGFAPEPPSTSDTTIRLRRCPFGSLARDQGDVVCNVHLGLVRGALRELGGSADAVRLEPFVEPEVCLVHVGVTTQPREGGIIDGA